MGWSPANKCSWSRTDTSRWGCFFLGPVIVNILGCHIFMSPTNLPLALVATALWLIVFFRVRSAFSAVSVQSVTVEVRRSS
jgi:hypothetical protein